MSKVIALLQKKGGAAKTTTCINLLGRLRELGYKAIVCDMDKEKPDALRWVDYGESLIDYVIPLLDTDPTDKIDELKLSYDFIIIDCSASLGLITINSFTAADSVIIPFQCEYFLCPLFFQI